MIRGSQANGRSVPEVLQDIVANLEAIARFEFLLAKTEAKEEVLRTAKASTTFAVGIVSAIYAIGLLLLAAVYALATVLAMWLAALVIGFGTALLAMLLIGAGRSKLKASMRSETPLLNSLKEENRQWNNAPKSSNDISRIDATASSKTSAN